MNQHTLSKENLKDRQGVPVGLVFKLSGRVGYITPNNEMLEFDRQIGEIDALYKSDLIVFDVSDLKRWDTLSLRVIFSRIIPINKELRSKNKPPISFVGNINSDVFDAAKERHKEVGTPELPWYPSLEAYQKEKNL